MYVCMYVCVYVCMYACMHVRMHKVTGTQAQYSRTKRVLMDNTKVTGGWSSTRKDQFFITNLTTQLCVFFFSFFLFGVMEEKIRSLDKSLSNPALQFFQSVILLCAYCVGIFIKRVCLELSFTSFYE